MTLTRGLMLERTDIVASTAAAPLMSIFIEAWLAFGLENACVQRALHFRRGFAHAGEDDVAGGYSCRQCACHFAARNNVSAEAAIGENAQDSEVGIGLDRKGDVSPPQSGNRGFENLCVSFQRRARIDVDRGPHFLGDPGQRNVFGVEDAVLEREMIHVKP